MIDTRPPFKADHGRWVESATCTPLWPWEMALVPKNLLSSAEKTGQDVVW